MNKDYKNTIKVYKRLGKQYIDNISKVNVPKLPKFLKLLPKKAKILDVGCAGGRDSQIFQKAGHTVIGIDIVDEFLKEARKRVPKVKFIKMDLMRLKFPNNYFDTIWAQAALLHFKKSDLPKILKQFYNKLKTGGLLHIQLKRGRGSKIITEKLVDNRGRFFTFYFKHEAEDYIKKAGFKVIASEIVSDPLKRKDVKWINVWGKKV